MRIPRRPAPLRAGILLAVTVLALAACQGQPKAASEPSFAPGTTMADLSGAGKITIAVKYDQPGFGAASEAGPPEGFDVEIGKLIAGGLGLGPQDITWARATSSNREELLEQGRADLVIATYTMNEARQDRVGFAGPYYIAGQQIMVRSADADITGPDDLHNDPSLKVCSTTGSTPAAAIERYLIRPGQLVTKDGYADCAQALSEGEVQAVTTDNAILLGLISASDGEFKIVGDPFTEEPYGIGIVKGDREFCTFIAETLSQTARNGSYDRAWASTAGLIPEARTPSLPQLDPCA
ncbi:glutamate ABC transporter substrate-binding protein [Kineosporia babensis]|uniref:Glutamate ABC transporter substrate-binding protein n=1 Tax=Kineosporia babensis TaxID=499548 RepID=A0A9X1NBM5_9ACTN|nr:glutamate ABC transporter substrate-binding protein [Kineosporia babensis]MCD5310311.1 glutamate ABC transporter substrate-binding protein [Kineosporia babensis]